MTNWMRLSALLLMVTPVSHGNSPCADFTRIKKIECEAGLLLNRGIDLFQEKDYAGAHQYFRRLMQSYPQAKDAVVRASFYNAECDRLGAKTKTKTSARLLKFKSETTHGQILSPGEEPPATTLEESQKELRPGSSPAAPPPR